jgi:hypothetical protein
MPRLCQRVRGDRAALPPARASCTPRCPGSWREKELSYILGRPVGQLMCTHEQKNPFLLRHELTQAAPCAETAAPGSRGPAGRATATPAQSIRDFTVSSAQ